MHINALGCVIIQLLIHGDRELAYIMKSIDVADFNNDDSAARIGKRIRTIREERGMTRNDLGKKVVLSADRIQQYENGSRKPKLDLLEKIAGALEVDVLALMDPLVSSHIGVMYAFFEMEKNYGIELKEIDGDTGIVIPYSPTNPINSYLKEWYKRKTQFLLDLEAATSEEKKAAVLKEYHDWEWTFPKELAKKTKKNLDKARLQKQIAELQEQLDKLDDKK